MTKTTRRQFIQQGALNAAGFGLLLNGNGVPFESTPLPKPAAANDRIGLGFIGFGIRGRKRACWRPGARAPR